MGSIDTMIEIKDLCFAYPTEEARALNHIDFTVKEGEFVVLCGKSGCGKSTLLSHMKTPMTLKNAPNTNQLLSSG